jgi:replicative DNA helicase
LADTIEELKADATHNQQRQKLQKLLSETAKADAPLIDITTQLKKGLGEIEANTTDLNKSIKPNDWAGFVNKLNTTPQGLHTGYLMGYSKTDKETGDELNELLIPNKAITIIAGRSGHGKTTAMLNLTLKLLERNQELKRVYFYTYEMPEEQLIERALLSFIGQGISAMFSQRPSQALRTLITKGNPQFIKTEYRDAVQSYLNKFKTEYIDTGRLTFVDARTKPIEEIRATITALRKRGQIDAVVIDYIQKFTSNQGKGATGQALMKYVCDELNGLANDTGLPIITGAQFNRSVEYLHDVSELSIREADDITHLGALILGIYNNEANPTKLGAYRKTPKATEEEQTKTTQYSHANTFYIEVLKNRFGTPGKGFNLAYCGPLQTLTNYNDGAGVIEQSAPPHAVTQNKNKRATRPTK